MVPKVDVDLPCDGPESRPVQQTDRHECGNATRLDSRDAKEIAGMNAVVWIVLAVLAADIALSGVLKLTRPKEKLAARFPWIHDQSQATVRFIGVVEVLGAIGLIVPRAT